jgi:hypothetical protein
MATSCNVVTRLRGDENPARHFLPGNLQGLPDDYRNTVGLVYNYLFYISIFRSTEWPDVCTFDSATF